MLTRDEAIQIAVAWAAEHGWGMREPVAVSERRSWRDIVRSYRVESDPLMLGTKARVTVDATTGAILDKGYLKR